MNWYALQVRSRYEEVARTSVEARGIDVFFPTRSSFRGWSDRIRGTTQPLFSGYLFLRLELPRFSKLLDIPGAIDLVNLGKQPAPIDHAEIDSLQKLLESKIRILDHPFVATEGPVRILRGPLRNVVGTVVKRGLENELIVSISVLQRSVAVQLRHSWLEVEATSTPLDFETPSGRRPVSSV